MSDLPPRCIEICPATEIDLQAYKLCLQRNCIGPKTEVISDTNITVQVAQGGHAEEIAQRKVHIGEVICRNRGLNRSVDTLITQ